MQTKKTISRRELIAGAAGAAACFTILPSSALGRAGFTAPSDRMNLAFLGLGSAGEANLRELSSQNIVALCDVDWRLPDQIPGNPRNVASMVAQKYPGVPRFDDWRVMLDKMHAGIDGVVVTTPDHTHAVAALGAMKMGKHVYCEKPLAHSMHDVRAMMAAAQKHPQLATQTGFQGHASEDVISLVEWIRDGAIGTVQKVQIFQSGPKNHPNMHVSRYSPYGSPDEQISHVNDDVPIPPEVKWDLWLGPAPSRKYNPMYLPVRWRNWVDFGTGILGDHGPHYIDPVFWALELGFPESIEADTNAGYDPEKNHQTFPDSSVVHYRFPARGKWPAVDVTWYGLDMPPIPDGWDRSKPFPGGGGILFGTKGTIVYGNVDASKPGSPRTLWLLPEELDKSYKRPAKTITRPSSHWLEWVEAAKAGKQPSGNWQYGGALTQVSLLGDIAIRHKGTKLLFDPMKGIFTNSASANAMFYPSSRPGWKLDA